MRFRWFGLLTLALALLLSFGAVAEEDPDEGWGEEIYDWNWEVRDGTFCVKEGTEYLGYVSLEDEEQYGHMVSFDLSTELDAFHYDPDEAPEDFNTLQLPATLRIIGRNALYNVHYFMEIIVPEGVEEIHYLCMHYCGAKRVYLPSTVHLVEPGAFIEAYQLETIDVSPDNPWYTSVDGVLYTKDMTTLVAYPTGRAEQHFDVPAGVKEIGAMAFCHDRSLHSVSLPIGLERIGWSAFAECVHLETVSLPLTLREIGVYAFCDCVTLERINLSRQAVAVLAGGSVSRWDEGRALGDLVFDNTPMLVDCWMKTVAEENDAVGSEIDDITPLYPEFDWMDGDGVVNPENASEKIFAYRKPDTSWPVIEELICGDTVEVTGVSPDWYQVWLSDGADKQLMYFIKKEDLLVRRTWEPLFRIASAIPVLDGVGFFAMNERTGIPYEQKQIPFTGEMEINYFLEMRGTLACCNIKTQDGSSGACFSPIDMYFTRYDTYDGKTYGMVISDDLRNRLNLRSRPTKDSDSLGKYFSGTQVEILEEKGDWYRVMVDFQEGWMMKEYIRVVPVREPEDE